jgi:hypothetical protein
MSIHPQLRATAAVDDKLAFDAIDGSLDDRNDFPKFERNDRGLFRRMKRLGSVNVTVEFSKSRPVTSALCPVPEVLLYALRRGPSRSPPTQANRASGLVVQPPEQLPRDVSILPTNGAGWL